MAGAAAEQPRPGRTRSRLVHLLAITLLVTVVQRGAAPTTNAVPTVARAGGPDDVAAGPATGLASDVARSVPAVDPIADQRTDEPVVVRPSGPAASTEGGTAVAPAADAPQTATVKAAAERIRPWSPYDVAVVGDSLTEISLGRLTDTLVANGWRPLIDGKASRSISYPSDLEYSAVDRVAAIKSLGVDPDTWLVQLGTNDLYFIINCGCADVRVAAIERVRMMLAAIGPGRRIVWVGVQNFDYRETTAMFNDVLEELVATGEISNVVDWEEMSAGHRSEFFADSAHLSEAGYMAWIPAVANVLGSPA